MYFVFDYNLNLHSLRSHNISVPLLTTYSKYVTLDCTLNTVINIETTVTVSLMSFTAMHVKSKYYASTDKNKANILSNKNNGETINPTVYSTRAAARIKTVRLNECKHL